MTSPREEVDGNLRAAAGIRTLRLPSAAYTDLLSTGNLRIIGNRDLRDTIVRFYEASDEALDIIERNQVLAATSLWSWYVDKALVTMSPENVLLSTSQRLREMTEFMEAELGNDFPYPDGRLWNLAPSSAERMGLQNSLLHGSGAFLIATNVARETAQEANELLGQLTAELSEARAESAVGS
ncbi:MAG: hypothetical protein ACR2QM_15380 [Longimicrobiales bacterium]